MRTVQAVVAVLALSGCMMPRSEHVLIGAQHAPHAGPVRIVMEGSPLPERYDEIAIVTATGSDAAATLPAVLGALQKESAALGADAVVRVRFDRGASGATATGVAVRTR